MQEFDFYITWKNQHSGYTCAKARGCLISPIPVTGNSRGTNGTAS